MKSKFNHLYTNFIMCFNVLFEFIVKFSDKCFNFVNKVISAFLQPLNSFLLIYIDPRWIGNRKIYNYLIYLVSCTLFISLYKWNLAVFSIFVVIEIILFLISPYFTEKSFNLRLHIFLLLFSFSIISYLDNVDIIQKISEMVEVIFSFFMPMDFDMTNHQYYWEDRVDNFFFLSCCFLVFYAPFAALVITLICPLISFFYSFLFGFLIGYKLIGKVTSFLTFISFLASSYLLFFFPVLRQNFINNVNYYNFKEPNYYWYTENYLKEIDIWYLYEHMVESSTMNIHIDFGALVDTSFLYSGFEIGVDSVGIIYVFTISFISLLVNLYSIAYMQNDPHTVRFFGLLGLFTFSMLLLVMSDDLLLMYIGWEAVGLSSYLLISFWYTRIQALKSALKAILMNKIGDIFLIFAFSLLCYYNDGDMSIFTCVENLTSGEISLEEKFINLNIVDFISLLIVFAAFVKSAQLFFHTWLPDAMEGPTPVSALLHAATMVTAGIFLVIKFSWLIEFSYIARLVILIFAVWTVVVTSLIALFQYDIKKIIAYSTCGQLGIMFIACSLSGYDFALFHFFNHAFIKCLLFLLAGIIIHELKNEQDIRGMGCLSNVLPITHYSFLIAMLSLIGFPFFSGAASKDLIISLIDERIINTLYFLYYLDFSHILCAFYFIKIRFFIVVLTSLYMLRLYYYVFLCFPNYRNRKTFYSPDYVEPVIRHYYYFIPIFLLTLLSINSGRMFKNFFVLTEQNYINIHNDILNLNADTFSISISFNYSFYTHFILIFLLGSAFFYFRWLRINGHQSFFNIWFSYYMLYRSRAAVEWNVSMHASSSSYLEWRTWMRRCGFILKWSMSIFWFFNKKCYFDDLYNLFLIRPYIRLSVFFREYIEKGFFLGSADFLVKFSRKLVAEFSRFHPKDFISNLFLIAIFIIIAIWFAAFF